MITTSHIRRLALIAVIGCAMLIGVARPAAARPLEDPALQAQTAAPAATAGAHRTRGGQSSDWTLLISLAGGLVLVSVATGSYVRRVRTSRRAVA